MPGPGALNLGQFSAALVYDTSRFGATSPVAGQAYRLQVTPTVGTLRFTSVLADYPSLRDARRRSTRSPGASCTTAGTGASGEDPRLVPIYLGYPNLVRGYDVNSFGANECTRRAAGACEEFDRLIGKPHPGRRTSSSASRCCGRSACGREMYGPVPIEVAFFADAGVAWSSGQKPSVFGGDRRGVVERGRRGAGQPVRCAGRRVRRRRDPFQRPRAGWVFQFNISPGF